MLIVHTSDLHLNFDRPETLETLQCILDTCREHSADLLTIGGDLFHRVKDVDALRPELRRIFSNQDFDVIAIPGNHDIEAYDRNLDFGDLKLITRQPLDTLSYDAVSIVGVPFTEEVSSELIENLQNALDPNKVNILLLHCTLDLSYESLDFGEEERRSYFSVSSSLLSELGYDFILAGHLHKNFYRKDLEDGSKFVYPGSPMSLSRKEIGPRRVALIDTDAGSISSLVLNTPFYDLCRVNVRPGAETEALEGMQGWFDERSGQACKPLVEVTGFGEMDEVEFRNALGEITAGAEVNNEYRNVENVLNHVLFRRFKEKLEINEDVSDKGALEDRVILVMSELLSDGKIR